MKIHRAHKKSLRQQGKAKKTERELGKLQENIAGNF